MTNEPALSFIDRNEKFILAAILIIAAALRIWKLDAPLWYDEIVTLTDYLRLPLDRLLVTYSSFNNHPFYSLEAKLFVDALGEAPWVLRMPAMLFGLGSIWLVWRIARTLVGAPAALLAAALTSLSYHHIWFSQNARGYTELMFWSLAMYALFKANLGAASLRGWGLFALCVAAGGYTHLTAGFFVAGLGLAYGVMLVMRWVAPARAPACLLAPADIKAQWAPVAALAAGGALTLLLYTPVLFTVTSMVADVKHTAGVDLVPEYRNPLWTVIEGIETLAGGSVLVGLAAPLAVLAAAWAAVSLWRRDPLFVLVAFAPILVTIAGLSALSMHIWPRFFFTQLAFVFILLAHAAMLAADLLAAWAVRFSVKRASAPVLLGLGAAVMLLASLVLAARNYASPKQDFPGPIALLAREGAPAQSVGMVGHVSTPYVTYLPTGWRELATPADLALLAPHDGAVWVVAGFPDRTSRENADIWALLERDFEEYAEFPGTLGDGAILVFRSKTPPAANQ